MKTIFHSVHVLLQFALGYITQKYILLFLLAYSDYAALIPVIMAFAVCFLYGRLIVTGRMSFRHPRFVLAVCIVVSFISPFWIALLIPLNIIEQYLGLSSNTLDQPGEQTTHVTQKEIL